MHREGYITGFGMTIGTVLGRIEGQESARENFERP